MLSAALAVLNERGLRPGSEAHHNAIIEGARRALPKKFHRDIRLMDTMRGRRHRELYDGMGYVSSLETAQALDCATRFVEEVGRLLGV